MNRTVLLISALLSAAAMRDGRAQDQDLRSGHFIPPPSRMSDEVARQKAMTYGVTDIRQVKAVGDTYVIQGRYQNRPVELELNSLTGELHEKGSRAPLNPANTQGLPIIRNQQIKVDRNELIRPELMPPQSQPQ